MWALKLRVREKWNIYNERAVKFGIKIYFYSHNFYEEKDKVFFVASGIVQGEKKEEFFKDLREDKKVKVLEVNDDFFICIYSEAKTSKRVKAATVAYNPKLIFLKPAIIDEEGWEEWEVASKDRKDLENFLKLADKLKIENEVLYFKNKKISNLMIYSVMPNLTKKQKQAFTLASENGFYGYPRKISLEKLAKKMKVSVSTFHFHLAKAEAKLMPFISRQFNM